MQNITLSQRIRKNHNFVVLITKTLYTFGNKINSYLYIAANNSVKILARPSKMGFYNVLIKRSLYFASELDGCNEQALLDSPIKPIMKQCIL